MCEETLEDAIRDKNVMDKKGAHINAIESDTKGKREITAHVKNGRESNVETTLFDSTGIRYKT